MLHHTEPTLTYILMGLTVITSLMAFNNPRLSDALIFWPYRTWRNNEWFRLLSGGFIHADIGHLFFNMFALYSFGSFIEPAFGYIFGSFGTLLYLVMYLLAIALADAYNLFKRKDDYNYRSLGASGGVSAIIFASIVLNPYGKIGLIFIPGDGIWSFAFGGLYLVYCAYMAKRGGDNIGHMAHFTGSIFGFFFPILFNPGLGVSFVQTIAAGPHQ
jgi:membrane associated rhomboid family serine protease